MAALAIVAAFGVAGTASAQVAGSTVIGNTVTEAAQLATG